jgi:F0F1-type ATP synthase assembly protein I
MPSNEEKIEGLRFAVMLVAALLIGTMIGTICNTVKDRARLDKIEKAVFQKKVV